MPKMKTHSSAKKRFSLTGRGKVRMYPSGKRHGMRKRSNRFIRQARGAEVMDECDAGMVRRHLLPNG